MKRPILTNLEADMIKQVDLELNRAIGIQLFSGHIAILYKVCSN